MGFSSAIAESSAEYQLKNSYLSLAGSGGTFQFLRIDPAGGGNYGPNLMRELLIGVPAAGDRTYTLETGPDQLVLRGLTIFQPQILEYDANGYPRQISGGERLGVAFHATKGFDRIGARFPTWHQTNSGAVARLYRLSALPSAGQAVIPGEFLGEAGLQNVVDNAWTDFSVGMFDPGYYFVEVSGVTNTLGWWGQKQDLFAHLVPVENGAAKADLEFNLRLRAVELFSGDWTLTLEGNRLLSRFTASSATPSSAVNTRMISDWDNTGYDLHDFPFKGFYGSTGQFLLANQLKRRPTMPQAGNVSWLHALGKDGSDLRFGLFGGTPRVVWEMEPDALHWRLGDHRLDLTILPGEGLPTTFPRFFSSDEAFTDLLTDFLHGHGFNLGAGASTEWKEWQSLILGWSDNPAKRGVGQQLLSYKMTSDGYVYTWGDRIGWPFPYKDTNGDGLNDYDTRHFTTNSNMISAISRHVAWTRDLSYLRHGLPRARLAMEYQLGPLQGADGLLVGNAAGQTGRNGAWGGNYWDILPFGNKDAFANIYFFNSLERMAELEGMANDLLTPSELQAAANNGPAGRAPDFYRALMETTKRRFTETFWLESEGRFAGCVDVDGVVRDYGFTFINLEALAYGLGTEQQATRIFDWLENGTTSSGEADIYSRWIFAPRATTIHNPPNGGPQTPRPTWYYSGWGGTPWETQAQNGGAILYVSGYDLLARSRFLGAENVDQRMRAIVGRYAMPDRLMGGSPLYLGERTQGGPGGTGGAVGVEGEFPESGLAPAAFLRTVLGIEAKRDGLYIQPDLPASLDHAGVENISYAGQLWRVAVTRDQVVIESVDGGEVRTGSYGDNEPFVFRPWLGVAPTPVLEDTFQQGEPETEIDGRPTSDRKARWQPDGEPGADVHLRYALEGEKVVFSPYSGEGFASVFLDYDVDALPAYSVTFDAVTLRGFSFGSNLMLAGRKGEGEILRHGYELRPHGGTAETGPDFWALWFRPVDGRDVPVLNITGSRVSLENLELRVLGHRQRLYQNGLPLDSSWRPTQNVAGDGLPDRAFQITLNTGPEEESFTHPQFDHLRMAALGVSRNHDDELIAYEDFSYSAGNILGRNGGIGWSEPHMRVFSRASPLLQDGMSFDGLQSAGGALFGNGTASLSRTLALGDIDPDRLNALGYLGKPGTSAWVSFLAQGVPPIQSGLWSFSLYRDNAEVLYLGKNGTQSPTSTTWRLQRQSSSGSSGFVYTGAPLDEPVFWVMEIEFQEQGGHEVRVYRDPDPAATEPPAASTASMSAANVSFNRIRIDTGAGFRVDEIRVGSTWDAVTPRLLTGYEAWRRDRFSEAQLADESISGDGADPWGEGIPNLMRYAFGMDEAGPEGRDRLPVFAIEAAEGSRFLTITYVRGEGRFDVGFEVESSSDLIDWTSNAVWVRQEKLGDGSTVETYRDGAPADEADRRFLRVGVRRLEEL